MNSTLTQAERIRIAMAEAGISQKRLAELSGIAQPNISRICNGVQQANTRTVDTLMSAIAEFRGADSTGPHRDPRLLPALRAEGTGADCRQSAAF